MLPGLALPQLGAVRSIDYAAAIAAITDKTIYCRADTATGADGATLTTTNWDNEAITTPNVSGNAIWKTGILNGYRGVFSGSSGISAASGQVVSSIIGAAIDCTIIAVEQRSGTQGANDGPLRRDNNLVIGDGLFWVITFDTSSRSFLLGSSPNGTEYNLLGASFTDNNPYVLSVQIDGSGNIRATFNGVPTSPEGTVSTPNTNNPVSLLSTTINSSPNYGFEYIVSSVRQSDAVVNAAVAALMQKWSIS